MCNRLQSSARAVSLPKPLGIPDRSSACHLCNWQDSTALWSLPAGKPLIISEFGMWRPMSVRNEVYQALYEELLSAKNSGLPVAGAGFPMWQVTSLRTSKPAQSGACHTAQNAIQLRSLALCAELFGSWSGRRHPFVYMPARRLISNRQGPRKGRIIDGAEGQLFSYTQVERMA